MDYQLSQNQIDHIQNLVESGEYHLAYAYIAGQIDGAVQSGQVSEETQRWFKWAEHINGDYDSFINNYARSYTLLGAALKGIAKSNEDFQIASNITAQNILGDIISAGLIPGNPKSIIEDDVALGATNLGIDRQDFAGTLIAGFLFDTNTINDLIFNDSNPGFWSDVLEVGEQAAKHFGIISYGLVEGGVQGLAQVWEDKTKIGDVFDAATEIINDDTFRDIGEEIRQDALLFFTNIANDYGWAIGEITRSISASVSEWIDNILPSVTTATNQTSPLVLDLDGDGVKLAALNGTGSVYWDGDQDGMAEASGWVSPQDGLLALDWNNDGIVTSHAELFGTKTTDGFVVLEALDTDGNNIINANDTEFSRLLVWRDANSDGYSQEGELHTLSSLGITAISLNESAVNYTISGNRISSQSTFTMNGQSRTIVDAWFSYDDVNTTYAGDYTLDVRALFLPTLRGYGDIADLHIAMSRDEDLLLLVQDVATHDLSALLAPSYGLEDKIRDILYRWEWVKNKLASNDNWQCPWHRSLCRFAA